MTPAVLLASTIYWHLPILVILVSIVYSATRFDEWPRILRSAWRGALYIVTFMGAVFLVLIFLSTVLPRIMAG